MQNYLSSLFGSNNGSGNVASAFDSFSQKYGKKKPIVAPVGSTSVGTIGAKGGYDTAPGVPVSSVGATGTQPVPKPKVADSPAKSAYVNSLASQGSPIVPPQNQAITGNATTPSGAVVNATTGEPVSTPAPDKNASYRSAFQDYINSLKPSDEETKSSRSLADLKLQNDQEYNQALERPGETIGSAAGEGARVNRNYAYAIDAESNRLGALSGSREATTNANKARVDFEKSLLGEQKPFEAGDTTYQYDPATGQYKSIGTKAGSGSTVGFTLSPGENRYDATGKLIASGGAKPPSQAQETAAIAKTEKEQAAQQSATQSIGLVNDLLSGGVSSITGAGQNPFNFLGLSNQKAINQYNQLQGLLKLGVRSLVKGQGAISDYEGKVLGQAASALGRNLSNGDFEKELKKIRGVLQTNNGGETQVVIKDKSGKSVGQGLLTGQDIYEAINDGNTVEYL